jgi:hypothetical protein
MSLKANVVNHITGTNLSRLFEITTFTTSPLRMFQEKTSDRLIDLAAQVAGCSGLIALVHQY